MIGEIRKTFTPHYDVTTRKTIFKSRPALVIAQADNDYIVLPISRVTRRQNLDPVYDIEVDPACYPMLNLTAVSYVRTHKQTTIHRGHIGDLIANMQSCYENLYLEVLTKREQFSEEITKQAMKE